MAELLRIANAQARPRQPGGFVETETARDVLRSLELVRTLPGPSITMVAGASGCGKTHCLHHFCAGEGFDAIYLSVASGEGRSFCLAENLLRTFNERASGKSLASCRNILMRYIGPGRVLVLDDAHYLSSEAVEWARALAAESSCDLIFCGGLSFAALVNETEQLRGWVQRPVVIQKVSREDVAAIVSGSAFDIPPAIEKLHSVARCRGGLRNVENALQLAALFAGQNAPDMSHLAAATADLKLALKGGA